MEYIASADQKALSERYRVTVIIVLFFVSSVIVLMITAQIVKVAPRVVETIDWVKILYTTALVIGLAVVMLRRVLLSRFVMRGAARKGASALLRRLMMISIIGSSLGEAVAVLGFIGYLATGAGHYIWRLGVIGLLLIVYSFPRRGEWVRNLALVPRETQDEKLPGPSGV